MSPRKTIENTVKNIPTFFRRYRAEKKPLKHKTIETKISPEKPLKMFQWFNGFSEKMLPWNIPTTNHRG